MNRLFRIGANSTSTSLLNENLHNISFSVIHCAEMRKEITSNAAKVHTLQMAGDT